MANIRNAISLTDGMTPVLRIINANLVQTVSMMSNLDAVTTSGVHLHETVSPEAQNIVFALNDATNAMLDLEQQVDGSAADVEAALQNVTKAASDLTEQLSGTGVNKGLDEAEKKAKKLSQHMHSVKRGGFNLRNLAAGVYLLKNALAMVTKLTDIPDTLNVIGFRLANLDESGASAKELMDYAYKVAQESRSDWEATSKLASRVLQSGSVGGDAHRAADIAGLLNKATFIGGSTSRESTAALFQLSQALASGVLAGDELRSIRENAPGLTQALSEGFTKLAEAGKLGEKFMNTSAGDLKQLGSEGELTSARIIAAIEAAGGTIDETFVDSPKQFGQAMTGVNNIFKRWLTLLSQGDGALARLNEKMWQFLSWLESADGEQFLQGLAQAFNFIVNSIIQVIDWIGQLIDWFRNLENAAEILEIALTVLGVVAVAVAAIMFIAWIIAHWPLLLIIAIIALVIWALVELGVTAEEIVGSIAGAFMFVAYVIWDIVIGAIMLLASIILTVAQIIQTVVVGIAQLIIWVALAIWSAIVTVYNVLYSIVMGAWGVIKGAIVGVYQLFVWLAQGVLYIIQAIAKAIDFVFGSNLAGTIQGWIDGLDDSVAALNEALDPAGEFEKIGDQWKDSFSDLGSLWTNDELSLIDTIDENNKALAEMRSNVWNWGKDLRVDPIDGWDAGYEWGENLVEGIGDFAQGLDFGLDISSSEHTINVENDFEPNGGHIDSIGRINDDVSITDEDIKMLKDIAAVEYVNKYTTLRPEMQVTFGDVKETADVKKILDVLEEMVEEAYASVLVEG